MFKLLISIVIFIASPAVLAWNTIVIKGLPSSARVVALFKVDTGASYIAKAIQNCKVSPEQNVTCITQGGGELKFKINNDGDYALFYIFKINLSSKSLVQWRMSLK